MKKPRKYRNVSIQKQLKKNKQRQAGSALIFSHNAGIQFVGLSVPAIMPAFESDSLGLIGRKRESQKHETRITAGFASVNGH